MGAKMNLPSTEGSTGVFVNGTKAEAKSINGRWILMNEVFGQVVIEVK
jgi:hypothetical protein